MKCLNLTIVAFFSKIWESIRIRNVSKVLKLFWRLKKVKSIVLGFDFVQLSIIYSERVWIILLASGQLIKVKESKWLIQIFPEVVSAAIRIHSIFLWLDRNCPQNLLLTKFFKSGLSENCDKIISKDKAFMGSVW